MSRYVGVDLHRRRSRVVVLDEDGQVVSSVNVSDREPGTFVEAVAVGGEGCGVVIEAAWGWYWIADLFAAAGFAVHLAHPLGVAGYRNRRGEERRNRRDPVGGSTADGVALREAWIAPPELRELRELVRYRRKLSQLRTGLKAQIHAVLGKEGVIPQLTGLWGACRGAVARRPAARSGVSGPDRVAGAPYRPR